VKQSVDRRASLSERMSSFPTPVAGLALGIASLGRAWENVLPGTRIAESAAVIAAALLTVLTVRFILYPATLARDLANPVVALASNRASTEAMYS
jgi:exfoliative toxin A/B